MLKLVQEGREEGDGVDVKEDPNSSSSMASASASGKLTAVLGCQAPLVSLTGNVIAVE